MIVPKITAGGDKRKAWKLTSQGVSLLSKLEWLRKNGNSQDQMYQTFPNGDKITVKYYGNLPHIHLHVEPQPQPVEVIPEWEVETARPVVFVYFTSPGYLPGKAPTDEHGRPIYQLPKAIGFVWDIEKNTYYTKVPKDDVEDEYITFPEDTSEFGDWVDDQVPLDTNPIYVGSKYDPNWQYPPCPDGYYSTTKPVPSEYGGGHNSLVTTIDEDSVGHFQHYTATLTADYVAWWTPCYDYAFNPNILVRGPTYYLTPAEGVLGSAALFRSSFTGSIYDHKETYIPDTGPISSSMEYTSTFTGTLLTPLGSESYSGSRTASGGGGALYPMSAEVDGFVSRSKNYPYHTAYGDGWAVQIYGLENVRVRYSYSYFGSYGAGFFVPFYPNFGGTGTTLDLIVRPEDLPSWFTLEGFSREFILHAQCDAQPITGDDGVTVSSLGRNSEFEEAIMDAYDMFIDVNGFDEWFDPSGNDWGDLYVPASIIERDWSIGVLYYNV